MIDETRQQGRASIADFAVRRERRQAPAGSAGLKIMADYQIVAIRADGPDRDYRIDAVQLADGDVHPIDHVIEWIRSGAHNFWTHANGLSVWVEVREHPTSGRLFLATENDGYPPNNLLSLPRI